MFQALKERLHGRKLTTFGNEYLHPAQYCFVQVAPSASETPKECKVAIVPKSHVDGNNVAMYVKPDPPMRANLSGSNLTKIAGPYRTALVRLSELSSPRATHDRPWPPYLAGQEIG